MEIVNRVANSALITLDIADFYPADDAVIGFDLQRFLFKGLIVREKEFRAALVAVDWELYRQKSVAVFCSADAIIPMWAYMLVGSYLATVEAECFFGTVDEWLCRHLLTKIDQLDLEVYGGQRVVVKGCGDKPIPAAAYFAIAAKLTPVVKSLLYGEPCSTVPVYKSK